MPTWTRTTDEDGAPGEWYLHLFSADQPDLNWNHPDVRREFEDVITYVAEEMLAVRKRNMV